MIASLFSPTCGSVRSLASVSMQLAVGATIVAIKAESGGRCPRPRVSDICWTCGLASTFSVVNNGGGLVDLGSLPW